MNVRTALFATASAVVLVAGVSLGLQEKTGAPTEAGMKMDEFTMPPPTKEHEWLKGQIGTWDAAVHCQTMGDSKGTRTTKAFGPYTIVSEYQGEMMGKPFKGMSFMTYDPLKKKYVSTWCDDMMPGIFVSEGTADAAGKKLTTTGEGCNMEYALVGYTHTLEIKSPDEHVMTMYETAKGPSDPNAMKIEYKRRK